MCIRVYYIECNCIVNFKCLFKQPTLTSFKCQFLKQIIEDTFCCSCFKMSVIRSIFLADNLGLSKLSDEMILDGLVD